VTTYTIAFFGYTEGLYTGMAGAASLCLLHIGHGEVAAFLYVENSIMADPAVVIVLCQVNLMAENHRVRVFKGELDVLRFGRSGAYRPEHY